MTDATKPGGGGERIWHRAIVLESTPGHTTAELEDNFHHLAVRLAHRGGIVRQAIATAARVPWTTCSEASGVLRRIEGMSVAALADGLPTAQRQLHCTHLLDLAMLAAALAGGPQPVRRRYRIAVTVPQPMRITAARLSRDGVPTRAWMVTDDTIRSNDAFAGVAVRDLLPAALRLDGWPMREALMLRRGMHVAKGLGLPLDGYRHARDLHVAPTCHTYRAPAIARAARSIDSMREFTDAAPPLPDRA